MPEFKITATEGIYAILGFLILITWFLWIRNIIAPVLVSWPPFFAFIAFNIGLFVALYFLASILVSKLLRLKISFIAMCWYIGIDIVVAPYLVFQNGLVNKAVDLWYVSSDSALGATYSAFVPNFTIYFSLAFVWIAVAALFTLVAYIKWKTLWKAIGAALLVALGIFAIFDSPLFFEVVSINSIYSLTYIFSPLMLLVVIPIIVYSPKQIEKLFGL